QTEVRIVGRHDQVACEHDLETACQGVAFYGCNHRLARRAFRDAGKAASGNAGAFATQKAFQVHPGAEGAASARDDADADVVTAVQFVQGFDHGLRHRQRGGVLGLGPVQRHDLDAVFDFNDKV